MARDKRTKAIETIELLYPADSQFPDTARIGRKLLEQAKQEVETWRNESDDVLLRYAELCEIEDRKILAGVKSS